MEINDYHINTFKKHINENVEITLSNNKKLLYVKVKNIPNFGDRNFTLNAKQLEAIILHEVWFRN